MLLSFCCASLHGWPTEACPTNKATRSIMTSKSPAWTPMYSGMESAAQSLTLSTTTIIGAVPGIVCGATLAGESKSFSSAAEGGAILDLFGTS